MVRVISYASFRARHFAIRNSLVTRCRPPSRCARRRDNFSPAWPREKLVGLSRFELLTPRLSSVCSNQLSYRPERLLQRSFKDPEPSPWFLQN